MSKIKMLGAIAIAGAMRLVAYGILRVVYRFGHKEAVQVERQEWRNALTRVRRENAHQEK
jgi:hypothetical protein